jgi:uncharacterized protein
MLLEFSVGNYLSFRERKTLNLVASSISDYKETNTITSERHTLLKGAVIYGANASGKSNFIRAVSTMKKIVMSSFNQPSTKEIGVTPFLLNTETEKNPSYFEVLFEILGTRYRYGFEVTDKEVFGEWLYESKKNAEKLLFLRERDGIEVSPAYKEAENLESKTRDNALFLSVIDQFNGAVAKRIMHWFNNLITISGLTHENYELVTFKMLDKKATAKTLGDFYNQLDLGFDGLSINKEKFNPKRIPEDAPEGLVKLLVKDLEGAFRFKIKTLHKKYDKDNKKVGDVEFDMRSQESAGTNNVFNISGPIFDVLQAGGVLVIDELDSSLHPLITLAITRLFNSENDNPKNAQLIFTTHDTNLFSYGKYRRDQIYFVEKDKYGASDLYSLVEYREEDGAKVRKDRSFENDYIQGRYGAVPYIGDISKIVTEWQEK